MHVPGRGIGFGIAVGRRRLRPSPALRKRLTVGATWWTSHSADTALTLLVLALGIIVGLIVARLSS